MAKIDKNSLGYLGFDYQVRLVAQILTDRLFANTIIDIVDPNYFEDPYLRIIVATIKDAKRECDIIPDVGSLEFRLLENVKEEVIRKYVISQLQIVKDANLNDTLKVQDIALKFCKQQELKKSIKEIQKIIDKGNFEDYEQCESILRKALEHGDNKDDGIDVFDDIDSVLSDDYRNPIRTGIKGLDEVMNGGLSKGELGLILAPYGVGKAQPLSSKILTPNGWSTMGEINIGSDVISRDGKSSKVIGVYPQGIRPIYRVSFNDGTSALCDKDHLWSVNRINQINKSTRKKDKHFKLPKDDSFIVMKTIDMIDSLTYGAKKLLNYKIPIVSPVEFTLKEVLIHPYVLGVLLGDGKMKSSRITTIDEEILNNLGLLSSISNRERCRDFSVDDLLIQRCITDITILGIKPILKDLGLYDTLSNNKFIPDNYLYNSIDNRISLLQGLLDTDGYVSKTGRIQFTTVSETLSKNVRELVLSLGGFCSFKTKIPKYRYKGELKTGKLCYILTLSFPNELNIIPFRLKRKLARVVNRVKYSGNKFIKSIEYSHDEIAKCIMIDNPEHLYVTDDYIVTHNTTMMTKIANTAMLDGKKVVQIFFEDMPKIIQRKHLSCWTGHPLNDLGLHKDEIKQLVGEMLLSSKEGKGYLKLKKFSSSGTTIPMIKAYLRKLIAQGFRADMVILDYIDCVVPSKKYDDVNVGEGAIMREFEAMLVELDVAGWCATQGNRASLKADVVEADQMSGSIKKGMIGHFIVSIAKTLDQKEKGTATMAILKSRFGKDGLIFQDITFDNSRIQIDMGENNKGPRTQTEFKKDTLDNQQAKINSVLDAAKRLRENVLNGSPTVGE